MTKDGVDLVFVLAVGLFQFNPALPVVFVDSIFGLYSL